MEQVTGHILIVATEPGIRQELADLLRHACFSVTTVATAQVALDKLAHHAFDLLLLDFHVSDMSCAEVVACARQRQSDLAVVVMSSDSSFWKTLEHLQFDGLDCFQTPTSEQEIVARVTLALRQREQEQQRQQVIQTMHALLNELESGSGSMGGQYAASESRLTVGDLTISTWHQTVHRNGQEIRLTPTEFRVLLLLARHAGQVMTNQYIVQGIKDCKVSNAEAAELIKPHIYHLRHKLEPDPEDPRYILTVRGTGYLLAVYHAPSYDDAAVQDELLLVS